MRLGDLFLNTSTVLRGLEQKGLQLEEAIIDQLAAHGPSNGHASLQELDMLLQQLQELSLFFARIGADTALDHQIPARVAISAIRLEGLAQSLLASDAHPPDPALRGEVDLF